MLVVSAVPQGSVLAPILFLLFINDITSQVESKIRFFADDCVLYREVLSRQDQISLNKDFSLIAQWCENWQMVINFDKTVSMSVTKKKSKLSFPYGYDSIILNTVTQYKYLGVVISSDLGWSANVEHVASKAMRKLMFLKRALRYSTKEAKLLAYVTFIRPILEYASVAWFPFAQNQIATLEAVQRKAARFICNRYRCTDSPTQMLSEIGLHTLTSRAMLYRLKFLYLILHNKVKVDPGTYLSYNTSRETRHKHHLTLQEYVCAKNTFSYSFFPRAIRDWNALAPTVVAQPTVDKFVELAGQTVLSATSK